METKVLKGESTRRESNGCMRTMYMDAHNSHALIFIKCCTICFNVQFFTVINQSLEFPFGSGFGMHYVFFHLISL